jgi:hypothetical protein
MRVKCTHCSAIVDAKDIDLARNIAKCLQCGEIFNCADQLSGIASSSISTQNRMEISMPKNFSVGYEQGGLVITRRWFSPQIVGLLFFCIFWDGFMIVWYTIAITQKVWPMAAFGSLHALVGLALTYSVVLGFVNRTVMTVSPGSLKIRHLPLPAPGSQDIPSAEITQLYTKENTLHSENGTSRSYEVRIKTHQNKDKVLISGLTDRDDALYIEQQVERYLGIMDVAVSGEVQRH